MTGWNLPPGCSVSDIPGNRPQDVAYDKAIEDLEKKHPNWSKKKVNKTAEKIAKLRGEISSIEGHLMEARSIPKRPKGIDPDKIDRKKSPKVKKMEKTLEKRQKRHDKLLKEGIKC